jgi:hypothetical protein
MTASSEVRQTAAPKHKVRHLLANPIFWIVFFGSAPLLILRILPIPHLLRSCDFVPYWAAGRLFLSGQNPYSYNAILTLEHAVGWPYSEPLMMLCPPWELPLAAIPALVSYRDARLGWLAISLLLDCLSCIALWSYFGGERRRAWIGAAIFATFLPMATAEYIGQITPLVLVLVVAFLFLLRRKWYFAAGVLLIGFGLKPHLLYLASLAVLLWAIQHRRWAMLAGGAISYIAATIGAFLYNSHAFDYLHNAWGPAVQTMTGPGALLRNIFGIQHVWLQFLPSVIGIVWFFFYWSKNRNQWDWKMHFPLLLLVSLCSAPYVWYHDFLLAAPALVYVAIQCEKRLPLLLPAWLLIQCAILLCAGVSAALEATAGVLWIGFYFYAMNAHAGKDLPTPVERASAMH